MCHKINLNEIPVVFTCHGDQLLGMIHETEEKSSVGVLIIVGGLQCRAGSHRQFVLLTRHLAKEGISSMRFDVRGLGDSEGQYQGFDKLDDDIHAAIDCFFEKCPDLHHVILWGLCDAASAALFCSYQDERIKGLVLLNPWVFTEKGAADTILKHYYWQRLTNKDFWRKLFSFKFNYLQSFSALMNLLKKRFSEKNTAHIESDLPTRMRDCTQKFGHHILFILSGNDLTATEFKEVVKSDSKWQECLNKPHVKCVDIPEADHTFSSSEWRHQVEIETTNWLNKIKDNL